MGPRSFLFSVFLLTPLLSATPSIVWNQQSLTLVQPGGVYGRMARLANREILAAFEWKGGVYVRWSADEGHTWSEPVQAASYAFGNAANPELLLLQNGSVMLSYNERPNDGVHAYTIRVALSGDHGRTWHANSLIYQAGTTAATGCWEPAQVQLPSGEIQLYFSNQKPYPATGEQDITLVRSLDNGATWTAPARASFRPGHRDGMPVPLLPNGGTNAVLSIEDNGLAGTFKPAIVTPATAVRWAALQPDLPAPVYAGAPYVRQFPSGETVLSMQSAEGRNTPGVMDFSRMMVYVGDANASNFANGSEPFPVPANANGLWNSLFVKNAVTVTAISTTTINGVSGIWAIDGRLTTDTPAVESVVNLASGTEGPVATGELVAIRGSGLAADAAVYFNGIRSSFSYAVAGGINALVPDGVVDVADVVVDSTYPYPLGVTATAPEIFAAVVNQDQSFNSGANPAAKGSYVSFWATGEGRAGLPVAVTIGGLEAAVSYAGEILPGVLQVNVVVPDAQPGDEVPVTLRVGTATNRAAATVAIR